MIAHTAKTSPLRQVAAKALPFVIIALAGIAARTDIAASHPLTALLLFLWIASDTMMLALLARSSGKPEWQAVLSVLAGASFVVWVGSPAPLRAALIEIPAIAAAMVAIVLAHSGWAAVRARHALRVTGRPARDRWIAAASEVLPPTLVRLAAAELAILHMALFRWGRPADAPAGSRPFAYHKHLTPMCVTLLVLSAIEMAVYHLVIAHWSRVGAIVMFVLSDVGFLYLLGLIKSFRYRPILLTADGVRVRAGFLIDQNISFERITGVEIALDSNEVRAASTLNAALLAWPNVLLRLDPPIQRRSLLKRKGPISQIAFRLDDPQPFVRLLRWRLDLR